MAATRLTTNDGCHFRSQLPSFVLPRVPFICEFRGQFSASGMSELEFSKKLIAVYLYQNVEVRGVKNI